MPFNPKLVHFEQEGPVPADGQSASAGPGAASANVSPADSSVVFPLEASMLAAEETDDDRAARERVVADSEIPEHLAALVEQLVDDAQHLVETYPAARSDLWLAHSARENYARACPEEEWGTVAQEATSQHLAPAAKWHKAAVAVLLIGLGMGGSALWLRTGESLHRDPLLAQNYNEDVTASAMADRTNPAAAGTENVSPAMPFQVYESLSGPEREGFLDWMEREGLEQPSLSI